MGRRQGQVGTLAAAAWSVMAAQAAAAANAEPPRDAAATLNQAVESCRAQPDDRRRLACYDAIRLAAPASATAPAATPASPAAPAAAAAARDFGLPPTATPAQAVSRVSARLQGRLSDWAAGTRLALDNGQVWQVIDGQGAGYALEQPQVTIERGLLGSFFATVEGVSASIKVRRLQ